MADQSSQLDDPATAACYVATLAAELAAIARQHHFDALSYILDMARLEAENTNRHLNGHKWGGGAKPFMAAD
jgi:hypothetical protein